jgi:alpha-L-rhamnosidase
MPRSPSRRLRRRSVTSAVIGLLVVSMSAAVAPPADAAPPASVATPVSLSSAHWIWYPEGSPASGAPTGFRYFRKTFTATSTGLDDAQLVLTGDDSVDVWLNGTPLASSYRYADSWRQALYVDLRPGLVSGANTLAIAVRNTGGPAGLVGRVHVAAGSNIVDFVTDGSWKSFQSAPDGWERAGFNDSGWPSAADLGGYGMAPWGTSVAAPDVSAVSPLSVASATTERKVNPIGVDVARPVFGWKLNSTTGQQRQGAYQLIVASTAALAAAGTGDVWDSGRVASRQAVDVPYGGPPWSSLTRYFWRVRVWDSQGRQSGWNATRYFDTGLRDPASEWQGDFIGTAAPSLAGATWIWYPEGDPTSSAPAASRYFRKTFSLASAPTGGRVVVTGDDTADVWVNGVKVSASPRVTDSWRQAAVVDIGGQLRQGPNTVAIASQNTSQGPAGVIAALGITGAPTVYTDGSWKASQSSPSGWEQPGFNDSGWPQALALVGYPNGPWGSGVQVPNPSLLLRKQFLVDKPVASARLLTTALGLQETRLNGVKVGIDVLAPGWTDYNKRLQYKVYDVTGQITQGANALGAWLGNGWFSGMVGYSGSKIYGNEPWYAAMLRITYTDGTSATVRTDGTWKYTIGPIQDNDLYMGEKYDARRATPGWDRPNFNDSAWANLTVRGGPRPNLVSQADNGITVQQQFRPVAVTQPRPGVWIFDLGQNFSGWDRLRVSGPAGTVVTLRHGEMLNPDGTLYTDNLRIAGLAVDTYTLAGTGGEPRFTVHGYRYVELTGFPGTPTADTLTGQAMWTSGAQLGTLTTSNTMINELQRAILWGERSNMLYLPTDCNQRNERLGWMGDIATFAASSTFNLDVSRFLAKFTTDIMDAQHSDGAFTATSPEFSDHPGAAGWGDAGVIVPYTIWQRYGDRRVVDQNFTAMTRWVDYLRSTAGADLIRDVPTYGDWLNVNDDTAHNLISTAYFAHSARLVSVMAAATGHPAEAATYGTLADQVAAAFVSRFVAADGTVSGNTQTGYVLALAFDLLPGNLVRPAADKLAAKVAATGGHLTVGFLGVENLLPVLADHGHADVAYRILLQPGLPGWGYMMSRGATTIWERWDGIRMDGTFNDPGMNSFNHYALGAVGDFLYRQVGGIGPASPGYQSLVIAPRPGGGLTSARAAYETPYGPAVSDWTSSGAVFTLRVTVPTGTSATVRVPAPSTASVTAPAQAVPFGYASGTASFYLPAGSYTFTAPA